MKLSVIMPVYNEKATVLAILNKVLRVDIPKEVIVIDDGSTDSTTEELGSIEGKYPQVDIVYHGANQGKGAAVRSGLALADGDVVVIQDGDLEYEPEDYHKLLAPIRERKAEVVYGSRVLGKGEKSYLRYYLGGRLLSFVVSWLYGAHITDEPTCYKMFTRQVLKQLELKCKGFEFCPEVTAKVLKLGYRIHEVPISYHPRSIGEGKKIRWKDGLIAIWTLLRLRFT